MVKIKNLNIIFVGISAGTRYRPQIKFSTTCCSCDSINYRFSLNKPLDDRDPRLVWPGRDTTSVVVLSNPGRPPLPQVNTMYTRQMQCVTNNAWRRYVYTRCIYKVIFFSSVNSYYSPFLGNCNFCFWKDFGKLFILFQTEILFRKNERIPNKTIFRKIFILNNYKIRISDH